MDIIYSNTPVVSRTTEHLFEFVLVAGARTKVPFTREISWLRSCEVRVELLHGGRLVANGSTYCDAGTFLSCLSDGCESAQRLADLYSVTQQSTLRIVATAKIYDEPVATSPETDKKNLAPFPGKRVAWVAVPSNWLYDCEQGSGLPHRAIERKEVGQALIWSSAESAAENAARRFEFIQQWACDKPLVSES